MAVFFLIRFKMNVLRLTESWMLGLIIYVKVGIDLATSKDHRSGFMYTQGTLQGSHITMMILEGILVVHGATPQIWMGTREGAIKPQLPATLWTIYSST